MPHDTGNSEIVDSIGAFLEDEGYLDSGEYDGQTKLFSSGLLSSIVLINLTLFITEEFGVEIAHEDATLENFDTLHSIADLVRKTKSA